MGLPKTGDQRNKQIFVTTRQGGTVKGYETHFWKRVCMDKKERKIRTKRGKELSTKDNESEG